MIEIQISFSLSRDIQFYLKVAVVDEPVLMRSTPACVSKADCL